MNRHLKLAFVFAPFLLIGGYGLADLYDRHRNENVKRIYELKPDKECNIVVTACHFTSTLHDKSLKVTAFDKQGVIYLETNYSVASVTFSTQNAYGAEKAYNLMPENHEGKKWSAYTALREQSSREKSLTARLAIMIGNSFYLKEMTLNFDNGGS